MVNSSGAPIDMLVIGGGINGLGIARDAAGRGLSTLVCERGDLAGATSSASTKLVHGGLRYLEHYEFRLVREALAEREVLLRLAPHLIRPLRFIMPHDRHLRPTWMIRAGLFLYDHLGGRRSLPASSAVDLRHDTVGVPLRPEYAKGFAYSDCWVDDARLVVANALDLRRLGGKVLTRTAVTAAARNGKLWQVSLRDQRNGATRTVSARLVVNAAGPWVGQVLAQVFGLSLARDIILVKGSHIVVPRLFDGEHAYIFQHPDRRVIFAIPYEERFTLVGTTDITVSGDPGTSHIEPDEIEYLCQAVNRYFVRQTTPADVIWRYSGVRPLYDDGTSDPSAITRDYVLALDAPPDAAPLLNIFGGKITTYRRLAEHALDKIAPLFPGLKGPWTRATPLPGGDIDGTGMAEFRDRLRREFAALDPALLDDYAGRYGSRTRALLAGATAMADLGRDFGARLYAREVQWLMREEWAETAEDVLWRRTKRGLHLPASGAAALAAWMAQQN